MSWLPLTELRVTETDDVQEIFDRWHERDERCLATGVPAWLGNINVPNQKRMFRTRPGYADFCPDVLWALSDGTIVMELKAATKGEPLALAQVAYCAWMLDEHLVKPARYTRPIIPVMVTQYNAWLRGALSFLYKRGLASDAVRYLEFGLVSALRPPFERVIWFDAPFAPWHPDEAPVNLDPGFTASYSHWYFIDETGTWVGLNLNAQEEAAFQSRPLMMDRPHTFVSQFDEDPEVYLVWEGDGPASEGSCKLFLRREAESMARRTALRRHIPRSADAAKEPQRESVASLGAKGAGTSIGRYADWLSHHAQEYAGRWVALRDGGVLDSDASRAVLERRLQASGDPSGLLFLQVPEQSDLA